jgi:hypothetical protein
MPLFAAWQGPLKNDIDIAAQQKHAKDHEFIPDWHLWFTFDKLNTTEDILLRAKYAVTC